MNKTGIQIGSALFCFAFFALAHTPFVQAQEKREFFKASPSAWAAYRKLQPIRNRHSGKISLSLRELSSIEHRFELSLKRISHLGGKSTYKSTKSTKKKRALRKVRRSKRASS